MMQISPRADRASGVDVAVLKVLKNDPLAIFTAASKAQAAANWMHPQQPTSALSAVG